MRALPTPYRPIGSYPNGARFIADQFGHGEAVVVQLLHGDKRVRGVITRIDGVMGQPTGLIIDDGHERAIPWTAIAWVELDH